MNMQIDKYTGEAYDADVWYRGEGGCWVNRQAEAEWLVHDRDKPKGGTDGDNA